MSLRGLQQTAVPGAVFILYGLGPTYLLSGVAMGWVYSMAWSAPHSLANIDVDLFTSGTPFGEVGGQVLLFRCRGAGIRQIRNHRAP